MNNLYLATGGEIEHIFENFVRFIDIFVEVHGNAFLIASQMWKAKSLGKSSSEGRMRRGEVVKLFPAGWESKLRKHNMVAE